MEFVLPEINYPVIAIACSFMVLDIITGFTAAVEKKKVDSSVMKMGLLHKCGFILAILFGWLCEYSMGYVDLGFTLPIGNAVCIYIILTEVTSILENLSMISPELANSKFMDIFNRSEQE